MRYQRRLLAMALWLILSLAGLKGWHLLTLSSSGVVPVWRLYRADAFLSGSWPLLAIILTALSVLYLLEINRREADSLSRIILWTSLFSLAALAAYPIGSKDLFGYAAYSRLQLHYGLNPYLAWVADIHRFRQDIFLKNMWWVNQSTPYGPLWTWLSAGCYLLTAARGLIPLLISYKLLGLLMHLLVTLMVYRLAESLAPGRGTTAAAWYGLNPLVIFELVVNGHNDGLAILFILIALYLLVQRREGMGIVSAALANAYKISSGLLAPLLLWRIYRQKGMVAAGGGLLVVTGIFLLLYLPFGWGQAVFAGLGNTVGGYLSTSLPVVPAFLGYPKLAGLFGGLGMIAFALIYLYLVAVAGRGNRRIVVTACGLSFLAYLALGASVAHIWYFVMPLALLSVVTESFWSRVALYQSILLLLSYILALSLEGRVIDFCTYLLAWVPVLICGLIWYRRGGKRILFNLLGSR